MYFEIRRKGNKEEYKLINSKTKILEGELKSFKDAN